jgi:predicted transcriptional regulator
MADTSAAIDTLSFLTRSEPRTRILLQLLSSGALPRRQFRDQLSVSRSTITRALAALEERDLVGHDGGTYHLTPTGRIVAETIADAVDTLQVTDELSTFLEWFPYSEYDIDIDDLRATEITVATDVNPYAPSRKHAEAMREAMTARLLLPSIDLQLVESIDDLVVDGSLSIELTIPPKMEETVSTGEFAMLLRGQIEAGGMTIFVSDAAPPFYVGLFDDDGVQVGVEDDDGYPRALLETNRDSVREWAEHIYRQYRDGAREKPAEEF